MTTETIQRLSTAHELNQRWNNLKANRPRICTRDAAAELGVSEAELIASSCGKTAIQLCGDFSKLMEELSTLGSVMALTRSDHAVLEKIGPIERVEIHRPHRMGSVIGKAIDLRLFFNHWVYGFAVTEKVHDVPQRSLQFFDACGTAVHKIFLTAESDLTRFSQIITRYALLRRNIELAVKPPLPPKAATPDADIYVAGLRKAWQNMQHTHEFFPLLKDFNVRRLQALRLVGEDLAYPVIVNAYRPLLEAVRDIHLPIMVFVNNPGTIQIHTGTVRNLVSVGEWYNILDLQFTFHLRETAVASSWIVRKPTADGDVTALELYDRQGELLAQFLGQRRSGQQESHTWRQLLLDLPRWKN